MAYSNGEIITPSRRVFTSVARSKTVDYKGKVARGEWLPPLPYNLIINDTNLKRCERKAYSDSGSSLVAASGSGYPIWTSAYNKDGSIVTSGSPKVIRDAIDTAIAKAINHADNKLLDKLKETSVDVIANLAQRKQFGELIATTLHRFYLGVESIRHPAKALRYWKSNSLKTVRHRDITRFRKAIGRVKYSGGTVSDLILEVNWAWRPLFGDVQDAAEAYERFLKKKKAYNSKRVGRRISFHDIVESDFGGTAYGSDSCLSTDIAIEGFIGKVIYYEPKDDLGLIASLFSNPVAAAWDIMPWSFLVDQLVDLGSYFDRLSATLGLRFISGYRTLLLKILTRSYSNGMVTSTHWYYTKTCVTKSPGSSSYISFSRQILSGFPDAHLEISDSDFLKIGRRMINDGALITRLALRRL